MLLLSLHFLFIGRGKFSGKWCGNDLLCWFRWSCQWLKDDFSVQSQPPFAKWTWPTTSIWRSKALEDTSQDRPLRLQEPEEGVCHHGEPEPPHHLCRQLLLMPGRRLRPLEAISSTDWKREDGALWAGGGVKQVVDQLCSSFLWQRCQYRQISMNMNVTTKEAFEQKYKRGKQSSLLLDPRSPSSILILAAQVLAFNAAGICQIQLQWWGWLITMMMPTMMMPTIMPTIMMLTVMMNTNGNGWWLGLVSLFGVQMYFPSILIIFPKSESANPSNFLSATKWSAYQSTIYCLPQPILDRQLLIWYRLCLFTGGDDYAGGERGGGHEYADHGDGHDDEISIGIGIKIQNVVLSGNLSQDPASTIRLPCSVWPLLDQFVMIMRGWRMMILKCMWVFLCVGMFCAFLSVVLLEKLIFTPKSCVSDTI